MGAAGARGPRGGQRIFDKGQNCHIPNSFTFYPFLQAYRFAPNAEHIKLVRAVIREDMSSACGSAAPRILRAFAPA